MVKEEKNGRVKRARLDKRKVGRLKCKCSGEANILEKRKSLPKISMTKTPEHYIGNVKMWVAARSCVDTYRKCLIWPVLSRTGQMNFLHLTCGSVSSSVK